MTHNDIIDLRCALPRSGWSDTDRTLSDPVSQPGSPPWRAVEYECESHKGHLLWGHGEPEAILTIPFDRTGWHAIHLLIAYADLDVRLTGEADWQRVRAYPPRESVTEWREAGLWGRPLLWEPLRFADLTGRDLEIRIPPDVAPAKHRIFPMAALWGVRVTAMPAEHTAQIQESAVAKRTIYIIDGFGVFFHAPDATRPIIEPAMEPFQNSHWDTCCYGIGQRGYPNYPSRLVDYEHDRGWAFVREGEQRYKDNVKALIDRGEDTLQASADMCHASGQKIWMYLRPQLWSMPLPFDHSFRSAFYAGHPEFRCREADGQPISKMSIAFAGIREHFASFIAEGLERDVDGICLALTRGYPLVRYEQPVLDRMQARFGIDARTLPDTDERLRSVWAEFVTEWFREIRAQLDAHGPREDGSRRELAIFVHGPDRGDLFGCDLATWVQEQLVDVLIAPATDLAFVASYTKGSATQLIPDLQTAGTDRTIHSLRSAAHTCYQAGADGLTSWDTEAYLGALDLQYPIIQKLWCESYMSARCLTVQSISGEYLNPFNPALGG